ncbi:hydrolase [Trichosporon asahii var. asahii CBS 8904]|uniref:Hydrolase n=1 Tax=Trichosporon asahii var. asahii (strain CBS 8904) TaxID=1220162 RepID=K1WF55_TRIAC|nr:hydrolase [Trichosporon asahii var. asahii CBS 8904]
MLAALLATVALAAPALAANHIKVQGAEFDLCIDNTDGKEVAGNPLQVWKCYTGSSNQAWNFSDTGKYPTTFKLGDSNLCMGVQQSPLADGAPVVLMDCAAGYDHTTWSAPNGRICLLGTNYCLQLDDDCAHDGTKLKVMTLSTSPSQLWDVKEPAYE